MLWISMIVRQGAEELTIFIGPFASQEKRDTWKSLFADELRNTNLDNGAMRQEKFITADFADRNVSADEESGFREERSVFQNILRNSTSKKSASDDVDHPTSPIAAAWHLERRFFPIESGIAVSS